MLETLLSFLGKPPEYHTPLPEADARHAMGALMVRAAKADSVFRLEEIQVIDEVLAARYDLNPVEAAKMRASCQLLESEMPDTVEMTDILKSSVSIAEREATVAALWAVVYADGVKKEPEEQLLREIERALGISKARAQELKQAAKG
ncbi:putative tellurite resistance protein B-like protein [Pacificibacter maritimus]|uniref:Putative tellurite resistance protein B-like protein n=1 Tax=Pacificibacter maritimus TaxID=762213 RepID=A0A3N4V2S8_9RHOB|nr:TerB family tellurite resistance protein [Pacificibacter maritimus]RPE71407.1 putative tellurite resistance protein B-like protein [Pacificibacter maritimus]